MREEISREELDEVLFEDLLRRFLEKTKFNKDVEYVNFKGKEVHSSNGRITFILHSMGRNTNGCFDIHKLKMKEVDKVLLKDMCTHRRRGTAAQKDLDFIYENFCKIIDMYY